MNNKIKNEKAKEKLAYLRKQIHGKGRRFSQKVDGFRYADYIDMTDEEVDEALTFHGKKCCRFRRMNPRKDADKMSEEFELVASYGEVLNFDDGEMISDLASDFEGGSTLVRCPDCGALFLHVNSKNCIAFFDDDYYTYRNDYYQVDSPEHAVKLNLLAGGYLTGYRGPHFGTSKVF